MSPRLPLQLSSLVVWQYSTSITETFVEQKPGVNWVIYSRAFKLEEYLSWFLKCLEKSLSYWLCRILYRILCFSLPLSLVYTYQLLCLHLFCAPKPPFLPLKCFCPFVICMEIIWPFKSDISSPIRTSRKLDFCFCILDDGVKSLWEACAAWIKFRL